jgi:hypothetical protein
MALQVGSFRDALIEAGATSTSASSAATEVAEYNSRLAATDTRLAVLTWMAGANIALAFLVVGSVFAIWNKVGDLSGQIVQIASRTH